MTATGEIEGEEDDEGKDGHFDNAAESEAVETEEDEGVEADAVDDFFVGHVEADFDL